MPLQANKKLPGGRVEIFAVRDDEHPGGWYYRFQYFHPDSGTILRYDNAHYDDIRGWHHRHVHYGEDSEIEFYGLVPHVMRYLTDIDSIIEAATIIQQESTTNTQSNHNAQS